MRTLDAERIRHELTAVPRERLEKLFVFSEVGSTNDYLLDLAPPGPGAFHLAFANHQTAGRGRLDKRWLSPPDTGLCMSMARTFARMPENPAALTLAIGIAVIEALRQLQYEGLMLKWPNDLIAKDRKLGGILTEMCSGKRAVETVVTGIGLNVDFSVAPEAFDDACMSLGAIDLRSLGHGTLDRVALAVALTEHLCDCIETYEKEGFYGFHDRWKRYDWLKGRRVRIDGQDGVIQGTANGIDRDGALLLSAGNGQRRVISGSVTALPPVESSA